MNLIEAIKSGKPFRLIGTTTWINVSFYRDKFNSTDLLAEYEIKQEPREWTFFVSECGRFVSQNPYHYPDCKTIKLREIIE